MRVSPAFALVALVLAAGGCGGDEPSSSAAPPGQAPTATAAVETVIDSVTVTAPDPGCHAIRRGYRYCEQLDGAWQVAMTLEARRDGRWQTIAHEPSHAFKRHGNRYWGAWSEVKPSPDGKTLLATWLVECDGAYAFFVPAAGGEPKLVTGELDWNKSPQSRGIGWRADGRARVAVLGGCGGEPDWTPGTYLIDPGTGESDLVG